MRPALVKVEAWRVEPVLGDSVMFLGLELIGRHDLTSLNVHGWALSLCLPLYLDVVES